MRKILRINLDGATLVGTYHVPADAPSIQIAPGEGVGILMCNSGYLPRASAGDLNIQLSDHLAELGYHVFRFDMPGLGDSPGDLLEHVLPFFRFIKVGGHAPWVSELSTILLRQFTLKGMVLAGNCGGAITAIYAAAKHPQNVLGVMQLDPDFVMDVGNVKGNAATSPLGRMKNNAHSRLRKGRQFVRNGLLQTPIGNVVRTLYRAIRLSARKLREMIFGRQLPRNANLQLIRCWLQLAAAEIPMLVLQPDSTKRRIDLFDYMPYLLAKKPRSVTSIEIEGTNHAFISGGGKSAVLQHVERWLLANVPPARQAISESGASVVHKSGHPSRSVQ
jgi:pimeloyl-ACP methyl ester carboxylesterase